jgi:hypothetical protein
MPSVDISGITVASPSPVNLYVDAFNKSIQLNELASLLQVPIVSIDVSCTTDISMSLAAFKSVFQFSIEDIATLGLDDTIPDLHFYVQDASLSYLEHTVAGKSLSAMGQNIIPAQGSAPTGSGNAITYLDYKTGGSPLSNNQLNVASDFTRYLALSIFGTPAGVDLFYNEQDILTDISNAFQARWVTDDLSGVLLPISSVRGTDSRLKTDISYGLFLDNSEPNGAYNNISRVLFNQILTQAPARFTTDEVNGLIQDLPAHTPQPIPFLQGDTVSWVLTVSPAAGQESLIDGTAAILPRTYRVRMHLV